MMIISWIMVLLLFFLFLLDILVGLIPLHLNKKNTENEQTSFG